MNKETEKLIGMLAKKLSVIVAHNINKEVLRTSPYGSHKHSFKNRKEFLRDLTLILFATKKLAGYVKKNKTEESKLICRMFSPLLHVLSKKIPNSEFMYLHKLFLQHENTNL
jgi:hypothetical protein